MSQKKQTPEEEKYLILVRKEPCLFTGEKATAHHVYTNGGAMKCSHLVTIPLKHQLHIGELHQSGVIEFVNKYMHVDLDPDNKIHADVVRMLLELKSYQVREKILGFNMGLLQ